MTLKKNRTEKVTPIQEIMGTIPSWTIRWGATLLLIALLIFIVLTFFIDVTGRPLSDYLISPIFHR